MSGSILRKVQFTPTIDTGIYAALDVLFANVEVLGAFHRTSGRGFVRAAMVADQDEETADIGLVFFDQTTSVGAANAAFNLLDADVGEVTGYLDFGDTWLDVGGVQMMQLHDIMIPVVAEDGTTKLNVAGYVVSGTPTFTAADDLTFTLWIEEYLAS
jgi:hypothetical protein